MKFKLSKWLPSATCILLLTLYLPLHAQVPKGDRILAWQVDMAENMDYDSAYGYALAGCMESIHLFFPWSSIEPDAGNFDAAFIAQTLDIIDIYHPAFGIKAELQIAPINTVARETPADLLATPWDSPVMINRFKAFLDTLFAHIPNLELTALNIGNESDLFLGTDAARYTAFGTFLDSIAPHAKQLYFNLHGTDLPIGTTLTLKGLTQPTTASLCQGLNANRDLIATTYYPLDNDFTMLPPSVVAGDFADLVAQYPDTSKPIYFVECGYASSDTCNSSEALQAQFYQSVFAAWDNHIANVKYLTIFKTNDWSQADIDTFQQYYGINDIRFLEYLRSLGVRTWDGNGVSKLAYSTILCELDSRGWCTTTCLPLALESPLPYRSTTIFPNPATHRLQIRSDREISQVTLYNQLGQVLVQQPFSGEISLLGLPEGVYHAIVAYTEGEDTVHRLIKKARD